MSFDDFCIYAVNLEGEILRIHNQLRKNPLFYNLCFMPDFSKENTIFIYFLAIIVMVEKLLSYNFIKRGKLLIGVIIQLQLNICRAH